MFAFSTARPAGAFILALGFALALGVGGAAAQQPSPTAIATAKEVLTAKGANSLYSPLVSGVIERTKTVLLRSNPMLEKDLNEVATKLHADYAPRSAEILNEVAKLYASRFTEQELKDALNFYKSPLGRKLVVEEPNILDQSMRTAQTWAENLSQEVIAKMRAEMKKRGHDI
jgi:uncharacterized protein